ncbi:hypothetical protein IAI58_19225 (plasmid) [Roseomonas marmotae]|uniref:Mor transcription activator family protein n=1 Tax=Roseomonas marmotae TaxID=2768161 RepID=UPI001AD618F3|nr:Mor transcription activator family protein [Roseomonas marmotae]QTI81476.1 hypothetical protein IAI58_19225 [Roseomonas marmotae]
MQNHPLPRSAQDIADIIGRHAALYLIGRLPTCFSGAPRHKSHRVILYVPKKLRPDHPLVRILGWNLATKLVRAYGGEMKYVANCRDVYLAYRNTQIRRMIREGDPVPEVAKLFGITANQIQNIIH